LLSFAASCKINVYDVKRKAWEDSMAKLCFHQFLNSFRPVRRKIAPEIMEFTAFSAFVGNCAF
jgi:hypothetical protein